MKEIYLIDGIGPFFRNYGRFKINWSKLPWALLESLEGDQWDEYFSRVREDCRTLARSVSGTGYTAVSLDDVAHLTDHKEYEESTRELVRLFAKEFAEIIEIFESEGLEVYLTMDILSLTKGLRRHLGGYDSRGKKIPLSEKKVNTFLEELIDTFFVTFPSVAGLILRIGESDGKDIKDTFRSVLHLKSPRMVNTFLKAVLPVFEKHNRLCIFRTWTVGAHQVGDLIWREATLKNTVAGICSPALVLSMKYGESDFFRHLSLNRNFFLTDIPTIVELQTRREYEGCGEYPSFVGGDYEHYARELEQAPNLVGISVWCNTGGWTPFRRLAHLQPEGIWTEINNWVSLRIFRHGDSVEKAISSFPGCHRNRAEWIELLRLSEEVVKELLYIEEFAMQTLYFRRVRIPPLLGVYWHNIFISEPIRNLLRHLVSNPDHAIRTGYAALGKIERMENLAKICGLPIEDIRYLRDTGYLLALGREYLLGDTADSEAIQKKLKKAKKAYKRQYPKGSRFRYAVKLDFAPFQIDRKYLVWFFRYVVRGERKYRLVDRVFWTRFLALGWWFFKRTRPKALPKFVRKSAMGIDVIFR